MRRRLVLILLALVVFVGCMVPAVFHDEWTDGRFTHSRNRLTGDITTEYHDPRAPGWWGLPCRSVFGPSGLVFGP